MIGFSNPAAFLLVLLVPLLYVLRRLGLFSRMAFPLVLADWNGGAFSWDDGAQRVLVRLCQALEVAAFLCMVTALAEPVVHHEEKVYTSRGADILFVLDTSPSMAARDIGGLTRLDLARDAIREIVAQNPGQEFGLVQMAKEAAVVVPPTMDSGVFLARLDALAVGQMGDGTALGTGLSCAVMHLASSPAQKKCIVLMTDGENNAGSVHPHTAARLARERHISLYVLGIGTRGTVQIEYADPKTGRVYSGLLNSNYDAASLARVASEADGKFFGIETVASLSQALASVARNEGVAQTYQMQSEDTSGYRWLAVAALVLLALAWFVRRVIVKEAL